MDGVRITISKHAILKAGERKIKTGRKITAQLWMVTRYMRYTQSPVPPQPRSSILPNKAPLKIWMPQTGITFCHQFPQKSRWLIESWSSLHTHRQTQEQIRRNSHNQWIFIVEENTSVSLLPMIHTQRKHEAQLQKLRPFHSSPAKHGTEQGLQRDKQQPRAWEEVKTCFKSSICRYRGCVSISTSWLWGSKGTQH